MRFLVALTAAVALAAPASAQEISKLRTDLDSAMRTQQFDKVVTTARKMIELSPEHEQAWFSLGYALHASGKLDEALEAHKKASAYPSVGGIAAYNAACVYSLKNQKEEAFAWLRTSIGKGFDQAQQLRSDSDLDNIRADERFEKIIVELGGKPSGKAGTARAAPAVKAFAGSSDRKSSRVFYWGGQSSPGQVVVDYGPTPWKDEFAKHAESDAMIGKRWRLGNDFWTTLDSNVDMKLGGVDVPAGMYYVTLARNSDGYALALNDPAKVRAKKLDAFQSENMTGGISIPLTHAKAEAVAEALSINLATDEANPTKGDLSIEFGPHRLTAPFVTKFN